MRLTINYNNTISCPKCELLHLEILKSNSHKSVLLIFKEEILWQLKLKWHYTFLSFSNNYWLNKWRIYNISNYLNLILNNYKKISTIENLSKISLREDSWLPLSPQWPSFAREQNSNTLQSNYKESIFMNVQIDRYIEKLININSIPECQNFMNLDNKFADYSIRFISDLIKIFSW